MKRLLIFLCCSLFPISCPVSAQDAPRYDWVKSKTSVSFVLSPGEGRIVSAGEGWIICPSGICTEGADRMARYDIKSTVPVTTGIMKGVATLQVTDVQLFSLFDTQGPRIAACYQTKVLEVQQTCKLSMKANRNFVMVRDSRDPNATVAVVGAAVGITDPLKNQLKENRVTVTFYEWKCVEFCLTDLPSRQP